MNKGIIAAGIIAALSSVPAFANDAPSFSFVEGGYTWNNVNDLDYNPDGYFVRGSYEINDMFYVVGDYASSEDNDVDFDQYNVGFGYKTMLSDNVAGFAQLSYANVELDAGNGFDNDESGYQLQAGFRGVFADDFEGTIGVSHLHVGGNGGELYGAMGELYYNFSENFSAGIRTTIYDDYNQWYTGLRYSF